MALVRCGRVLQNDKRTGDVRLLHALLRQRLCEHVGHPLWRERDWEGESGVVPRHRRDVLNACERAQKLQA